MTDTQPTFHTFLTSKLAAALNWAAATTGIMTFTGAVNTTVALLSRVWLATQLWHHYKYVRPKAKRELEQSLKEKSNDEAN